MQTFFVDEDMQSQISLDAVVTVVDAKHIWSHWESSEAQEQIAFADVILLNKTDLGIRIGTGGVGEADSLNECTSQSLPYSQR